jgi:hypothetical protein
MLHLTARKINIVSLEVGVKEVVKEGVRIGSVQEGKYRSVGRLIEGYLLNRSKQFCG